MTRHLLLLLALVGLGVSPSAAATPPPLVTLRPGTTGAAMYFPPSDRFQLRGQHHSATFENLEVNSSDPWYVAFKYTSCPVTRRGAFRLTIYREPLTQASAPMPGMTTVKSLPSDAYQYTRTLVDRHRSHRGLYHYPGLEDTRWFYKIDIPAKQGCKRWDLWVDSN